MFRPLVVVALVLGAGCTKRQQDFAWFAAAVALEAAAHANAQSASEPGVAVAADQPAPTIADLQRAYHVAMELTRLAAHDARIDNCPAVARTAKHVRVIDRAVYANVFLRDAAIQSCLAAPAPTSLVVR